MFARSGLPTTTEDTRRAEGAAGATPRAAAIRVLVAGGESSALKDAILAALRRDRRVDSAESLSEPAEALIWARFGSADLVVVFPDAAPFPAAFESELASHDCRLVGVITDGDTAGETILIEAGITRLAALDEDLDLTAHRVVDLACGADQGADFESADDGTRHVVGVHRPRSPRVVTVASLGTSAGSTTLAAVLTGVLAEWDFEPVLADLDLVNASLTGWLVPSRSKRSGEKGHELAAGGDLQGLPWKLSALGSGGWIAGAGLRPALHRPGDQQVTDLLHRLVGRFRVVVADAGGIFRRPGASEKGRACQAICRFMSQNSTFPAAWILVCRADPPGLKAFLEEWPAASSRLGGVAETVIAMNGIPTGLPSRKLLAFRRSIIRATGCRKVVGLPHDPSVRSAFWEGRIDATRRDDSEFFAGVRSLAENLEWLPPPPDGWNPGAVSTSRRLIGALLGRLRGAR